jgi:hypothetical protein
MMTFDQSIRHLAQRGIVATDVAKAALVAG